MRDIFQASWLSPLRFLLWKANATRDKNAVMAFTNGNGFQELDFYKDEIVSSSKSETLFILGSGWSVNELTSSMISHISSHQSIGINFWFFHDFVPTAFAFDAGRVPLQEREKERTFVKVMGSLFNRAQILKKAPKVLYLRPFESNGDFLIPIDRSLRQKSRVYGRANFVSNNRKALKSDLRLMIRALQKKRIPASILPDNGSSVVRMIFLGIAKGFKKIVLTGVDLDERPHFWFSEDYTRKYEQYVKLFPTPDNKPHGTSAPENRAMNNLEFLEILNQVLGETQLSHLYVASSSSQLSSVMDVYVWPVGEKGL